MKDATDTATVEVIEPAVSQPGLTLVFMNQVTALSQVRTSTGWDDASLAELGNSIITSGLLQMPLLRPNPDAEGFLVVAGHRRIEAMRRAGFTSFYAMVGKADNETAHVMQLTENLHREQLSTKETAWALRTLSDQGKKLTDIAEMVNKSKAWVCKHLALTHPDFGSYARELFVKGTTEDVELLNSLSQAEKAADEAEHFGYAWLSEQEPKSGKWTRKAAAEAAKKAKALIKPDDEENEESDNEGQTQNSPDDEHDMQNKMTAQNIQTAMESAIDKINKGEMKADFNDVFAYVIGYACGEHHKDFSETTNALFKMCRPA